MHPDAIAPPDGTKTPTLRNFVTGPILKWASIVGGAITLFGNLSTIFDLAEWARWLVTNWDRYIVAGWHRVFAELGIVLPRDLAQILTYLMFLFSLAISARKSMIISFNPKKIILTFLRIVLLPIFAYMIFITLVVGLLMVVNDRITIPNFIPNGVPFIIINSIFQVAYLYILKIRDLKSIILCLILFYTVSYPIAFMEESKQTPPDDIRYIFVPIFAIYVLPISVIWIIMITERKALLNRLLFLALGLVTLIAMNELWLLHGYLKPPAD